MPTSHTAFAADRRAILRSAILLVGGIAIAPELLAATGPTFFSPSERAQLDLLCETMIPTTDTPGAIAAGVPAFLDTLMANWASPKSRAHIQGVIASLARAAEADTGKPLAALSAAERADWLARRDSALLAAKDPAYRQFKQLVLTGYYYSEAGATQELRYELVPGAWEPSIPVTADTRSWAA
ncbi:gluconate 2-dehydrogenase subunit 3 family protein [Sphingomonas radiodurans]|uniref:gluconate 2-dehydrogenase subunit 3 family protein n=1 Tax=Sphingomonas radiodurans TaxID=2890321 RepID=UPI001E508DE0|nr:gluconate 2-dehydrogenase subunit 3 family protein [Sphingomonas radiodurans]WBH15523.1 gluconate 2-dehydrogenase subunit 3 family protein [Sphingomonas radiodurans]